VYQLNRKERERERERERKRERESVIEGGRGRQRKRASNLWAEHYAGNDKLYYLQHYVRCT